MANTEGNTKVDEKSKTEAQESLKHAPANDEEASQMFDLIKHHPDAEYEQHYPVHEQILAELMRIQQQIKKPDFTITPGFIDSVKKLDLAEKCTACTL